MAIAAGIKIQNVFTFFFTSFVPRFYGGGPSFTHLTKAFNFTMQVPDIICHIESLLHLSLSLTDKNILTRI